jgi:hypothetical protein
MSMYHNGDSLPMIRKVAFVWLLFATILMSTSTILLSVSAGCPDDACAVTSCNTTAQLSATSAARCLTFLTAEYGHCPLRLAPIGRSMHHPITNQLTNNH